VRALWRSILVHIHFQYIAIVIDRGWIASDDAEVSKANDRKNVIPQEWSYDQVGNITQIVEASSTNAGKTITYTYDDLHRLLTSSITGAANGDNTGRTYTYSAIGNILTASDQGTYLYEGTNYANPHAVTKVGSAVYAYDNNGNLTSDSTWTHTWNYANQLTQSTGGSTVTYQYDHTGQRTKYYDGVSGYARHYPNKLYNIKQTTATKHIYAGSQLIATVEGSTLQYLHTDHLTGSNVATNSSGGMVQLLDYYPYGSMRIDWKSGSFDEQRKFTGHEFDRDTSLTYANARYYKQNIGRFLSQDPVFLSIGDEQAIQQGTNMRMREYLSNPQYLNSYSYVTNNPLKYVDKGGEFLDTFIDIGFIAYDLYKLGGAIAHGGDVKGEMLSLGLDIGGAAIPFATGLGAAARVTRVADKASDAAKAVDRAMNFKSFTSGHFRGNLIELTGKNPGSGFDAHHMLPQTENFRGFFERAGINVHDPKYGSWWQKGPDGTHQKLSNEYNARWEKFISKNPNASQEQIHNFANETAEKYRIDFKIE